MLKSIKVLCSHKVLHHKYISAHIVEHKQLIYTEAKRYPHDSDGDTVCRSPK